MRRAVDGVIMVPYRLTTEEIDDLIKRTGTAVVALGQHVSHPEVDVAYADDELATRNGIRWLIEAKGHRRIGFIGTDARFPPGFRRWRAFQAAMADAGLPIEPSYVQHGDFSSDSGYACMQLLLSQSERPTAVFACNDRMAIGAIGAAQDMNVSVPKDVAVMGFDNIPEATLIRPHLTTIAQHPKEIGLWLARAVLDRIEERNTGAGRRVEFPCELIEREST
jgi:DNA-binding LacI/PurR family transcriptional regulator